MRKPQEYTELREGVLRLSSRPRTSLPSCISLDQLTMLTDMTKAVQTPRNHPQSNVGDQSWSRPPDNSAEGDQKLPNIQSNVGDQSSATSTGRQPSTLSSMDPIPKDSNFANLRGGSGGDAWPLCLCCLLYHCLLYHCFCKECYDNCQRDCSDCSDCC